jgi:5-formyltetrahydrofolate cyclo-ligase
MSETKAELRTRLKFSRLEMTDADYTRKGRAICDRLKETFDWSQVRTLHYFEPIRSLMEVDTGDFITFVEDTLPDMHLATSRKIGMTWEIFGVRGDQPAAQFDVIIVPMLGFDEKLQRVGFGGGYYDRLLATQPQARKIGVCFEQGRLAELIPAESHDIPLDMIITETAAYSVTP